MNWRNLSPKTKWALVMMLVAIIPTVAGVTIGMVVFEEAAPPFVYAFPVVWLVLLSVVNVAFLAVSAVPVGVA